MKTISKYLVVLTITMLLTMCQQQTNNSPAPTPKAEISEFIGHWSLDIDGGGVGWLGVTQEDGYVDAGLLWKGGSVWPVAHVFLVNDKLVVTRTQRKVRTRDEEGEPDRSHMVTVQLEMTKVSEDTIQGNYLIPNENSIGLDTTEFLGVRFPEIKDKPDLSNIQYGEPVELFNGEDLSGWKLINENQKNGWSVVDGVLVNNPVQPEDGEHIRYGNLRTEQEFEDFNLKLEVNIPEGNNSGIYLRGIYEIQVLDSYGEELDSHNMGALYSRITPSTSAEKPAGSWQEMDITLANRHITVKLNGTTIIDNQPALGPTGGAMSHDVFAPGPIYLQGDHGKVSYRNIILTPIK